MYCYDLIICCTIKMLKLYPSSSVTSSASDVTFGAAFMTVLQSKWISEVVGDQYHMSYHLITASIMHENDYNILGERVFDSISQTNLYVSSMGYFVMLCFVLENLSKRCRNIPGTGSRSILWAIYRLT